MENPMRKETCKKDISCLDELKEKYLIFKEKHNLPEFNELNMVFDIEEVDFESDFLLRKIRRYLSEKFAGYMRFIEVLLNPVNAPIYFFKLIKRLDDSNREALNKMYDSLGKIEIEAISLDLDYDESKEAEFIKKLYKIYNDEIKKSLLEIVGTLENGEDEKKKDTNGSYFG